MTPLKYILVFYSLFAATSCSSNDKNIIISRWDNGNKKLERLVSDTEGVYIEKEYYENGRLAEESRIEDSVRQGKSVSFYKDGQLLAILNYDKGKIHGQVLEYHKNGNLMFKGTQKHGELTDTAVHFYDNGRPKIMFVYKDRKRFTISKWDTAGNKMAIMGQ